MSVFWLFVSFYAALALAMVAQIIAFLTGRKTFWRFVGLVLGIGALGWTFAVSQIASDRVANLIETLRASSGIHQ